MSGNFNADSKHTMHRASAKLHGSFRAEFVTAVASNAVLVVYMRVFSLFFNN